MDSLPRLHYKKARIPLPVDELFQQSITAGDIVEIAVQIVRAFLCFFHIILGVAVENTCMWKISTLISFAAALRRLRMAPAMI